MDGKANSNRIERITAASGDFVFKINGRLLGSAVDPRREAREWVNRWRSRIAGCDRLVVLGWGCGYHLQALADEWPTLRVLALGFESELFAEIDRSVTADHVELVLCREGGDVLADERIRRFMRSDFAVVEHTSIANLNPALYAELKQRLLAREPIFFSDWIRREARLLQLFPLQAIPGGESRSLLSIKDLDRFANARAGASPFDVMIVRALRELVK